MKAKYYETNRAWRLRNPEKMREYQRIYEKRNKKELAKKRSKSIVRKEYQKKYGKIHRKAITKQQADRFKKDPILLLKKNLRNRLLQAIKRNSKTGSAVKDLGCTIDFFKKYLESLFQPDMTWENYGKGKNKWQIDHIKPLCSFNLTNIEEFLKACNYTNLQPLWHKDHIVKTKKDLHLLNKKVR